MTLQLDENGLQIQTQQEIADELGERLRAQFGVNLKLSAKSNMGQIVNVVAELRALSQQMLQAVYSSLDPDSAEGVTLDKRLALTGTQRLGNAHSTVNGTLTFSSAGTMSNGDQIQNDDNETLWALIDGPHTSSGPWPETIAAQFQAVDPGPILANASTTWSLVTSVTGLDSFANPSDDAEPGRLRQQDPDARRKRITELYSQGQGPLEAIKGVVSKVDGVQTVRVYHNPDIADGVDNAGNPVILHPDGVPFKAFNVVVETSPATPTAAQQQAIWDAIWSVTGAGGRAYATGSGYSGTVTDVEGEAQPVAFDVVTQKSIKIDIYITTSTSEAATSPNIATTIKTRVLEIAQAEHEKIGRDVLGLDYRGIVQQMQADGEISGVDDVKVSMAISPATPDGNHTVKVAIGVREKPDFNSADVTVTEE